MLQRLKIYLDEMYPVIPRLGVAIIYFFQLYFVLLLNEDVGQFQISIQEWIGVFTVFSFLLLLRIADDFKDYELDKRLFAHRALPSGRVYKEDLRLFLALMTGLTIILNFFWMNNFFYFVFLYTYGTLMSFWFFQKSKIQNSLPLALVTHNPVMLIMNLYIISFVVTKYHLAFLSPTTIMLFFSLYFPSLIWEISRKIRAPKDETEYVTYSKLFGYQRVTRFVAAVALIDLFLNIVLLWELSLWAVLLMLANYAFLWYQVVRYNQDPNQLNISKRFEIYIGITEATMLLGVLSHLLLR